MATHSTATAGTPAKEEGQERSKRSRRRYTQIEIAEAMGLGPEELQARLDQISRERAREKAKKRGDADEMGAGDGTEASLSDMNDSDIVIGGSGSGRGS
eukprot:4933556-Prorocentrum_lima.AAC.1